MEQQSGRGPLRPALMRLAEHRRPADVPFLDLVTHGLPAGVRDPASLSLLSWWGCRAKFRVHMTVKEGGWAEGEDEDSMSCSADSRHGCPKRGRAAWIGSGTVLEMGKWVAFKGGS